MCVPPLRGEAPSGLAVRLLAESVCGARADGIHPRLALPTGVTKGIGGDVEAPLLAVLRDPGIGQRADRLLAGDPLGAALEDDVRAAVERVAAGREHDGRVARDVARLALL